MFLYRMYGPISYLMEKGIPNQFLASTISKSWILLFNEY